MSSPSACFSSSSRSMRSINDFSCAPAIPPTSGIIPSPPVVMLPPQQGRDDSLRARLAQGREANVPKPINAWGTGRDDTIKGNGNDSTFPLPRGIEGGRSSPSTGESTANLASSFRVSHRPRASRPRRRPPTVERVEHAPEEPRLGMDRTIDRRKSPRTLLIIIFDIAAAYRASERSWPSGANLGGRRLLDIWCAPRLPGGSDVLGYRGAFIFRPVCCGPKHPRPVR